jgi:hypothetical protein
MVDGCNVTPLVIDLERDALEVRRTSYRKSDPQVGQVDFSQKTIPGLAYPTADDVRSSLPTPVESREYLGHVLNTLTPPPIPIRIAYNDESIRSALRALDDAVWDMSRSL